MLTGIEKASMATKCIDQIPPPRAIAALPSQTRRAPPTEERIRPARLSEAKEAKVAMKQESATSLRSYCPCRIGSAMGGKSIPLGFVIKPILIDWILTSCHRSGL